MYTTDEVRKVAKGMTRGKAAGEDGITSDLIKGGGDIISEKLASLFTKCIKTSSVPLSWKNANIMLIHKKGDIKELKNYRPISLLAVIYKLFTKVILARIRETSTSTNQESKLVLGKGTQQWTTAMLSI